MRVEGGRGNETGVPRYRDTAEVSRGGGPSARQEAQREERSWKTKPGDDAIAADGHLISEEVCGKEKRASALGGGQAKILQRYTQTTSNAVMRWQNLKSGVVI